MSRSRAQAKTTQVVENLHAPCVYGLEATHFSFCGGNVTIVLTAQMWDHNTQPPTARRVVVGRIVLPELGARDLATNLFGFLQRLGRVPAAAETPSIPMTMQ